MGAAVIMRAVLATAISATLVGAAPSAPTKSPPSSGSAEPVCSYTDDMIENEFGLHPRLKPPRLLPVWKQDVLVGFRLDGCDPKSMFLVAGLRDGDTITQVNETRMTSLEHAGTIFAAFQTDKEVRLHYLRDGVAGLATCRFRKLP